MRFKDRSAAGQALAERVRRMGLLRPVVYGVARGGMVVAASVSEALACELDVVVPRKLPHPANEEVAIGAVGEDGQTLLDDALLLRYGITNEYVEHAVSVAVAEIRRRAAQYRGGHPRVRATGRDAVLVDDGIATGYTLLAAAHGLREDSPRRLIIAVPVAPPELPRELVAVADEMLVLEHPDPFYAVGQAYDHFDQVDDATVIRLMSLRPPAGTPPA